MPYQYVWISDAAGEIATLIFYVMTGFYFRPHAENPYFALQDDEISLAVRIFFDALRCSNVPRETVEMERRSGPARPRNT